MQKKKKFFTLFLVLALAFVLIGGQIAVNAKQSEMSKVIISFHEAPGNFGAGLIKRAGGQIKHQYKLIPAIAASVPEAALKGLSKNPNIKLVEPDIKIQATDVEMDNSWGVEHIGSAIVHADGNQGEGIKIAILDTGIDHRHTDLDGNFAGGFNFIDNNTRTMDDNGHGTHVAGTIAAEDDGQGVVGVAPKARIYAYKILDSNGSGNISNIVAALEMAVADGIQITNNSYGWPKELGSIDAVDKAFIAAGNAGIINIAAAGNSGVENTSLDNVNYPARYNSVIAVAATDQNNARASFSSTGIDVEISAPGVGIVSTYLRRSYASLSGTSMACPHVVGTVALMLTGGVLPENVRGVLQETADDLGLDGLDSVYGYGLVDASEAVLTDIDNQPPVAIASYSPSAVYTNTEVNFTGSESFDPDGENLNYAWDFGDGFSSSEANPVHSYNTANTYTVTLTVTDAAEAYDTETLLITVIENEVKTMSAGLSDMSVRSWAIFHEAGITVIIRENDGTTPVSGASVSGDWTGIVSGSSIGTTNENGEVRFTSPSVKKTKSGTFTFTVNNVSHSNYSWDNVGISNSISY